MQEFQEIKDLRKCLIKGGKEIRVKTLEDWYLVTNEQATQVIGRKYINRFGSMFETLKIVFPEHEWLPCVPDGFWQQKENQRSFLDYVSKILGIKSYEDWYKVTNDEILRLGGSRLLFIYEGDLLTMLQRVYPEFAWESQPNRTLTGYTSKSQMHLFSLISDIFSGTEVFMNHFLGPGFRYSNTRKFMEVDIFVPEHKLAFEYQGRHHYEELQIFGSKLSQRQKRDQEKRQTLETAKITLIDIPYTWNGSKEDLLVTIHKQRPDLNLINPGGPIGLQLKRRKREKNSIDEQSQNE